VSGAGVTKSTDSHSGNYAVQLESVVSFNGDSICLLTNGSLEGEDGPTGGMPVFEFPKMITGYYKYTPVGNDLALAGLWLYHYDSGAGVTETLQESIIQLPPASEYTYFELPVLYYNLPAPDTLNIAFAPSNYEGSFIGLGSTLLVDDLEITYQPFITSTNENHDTQTQVYPNPARDKINIWIKDWINQEVSVSIINLSGETVYSNKTWEINNDTFGIDVRNFDPGMYFYSIDYNGKTMNGKFIIE